MDKQEIMERLSENRTTLCLNDTDLTDDDLKHLKGLTGLYWLYLNDTQITDSGLVYLQGLTELRHLHLYGTKVTEEGVYNLKEDLPVCKIYYPKKNEQ